jgi:hypothetical protein
MILEHLIRKKIKSYSILSILVIFGTTSTNNDAINQTKEKAKDKSKKVRFCEDVIQKAMTTKLGTY